MNLDLSKLSDEELGRLAHAFVGVLNASAHAEELESAVLSERAKRQQAQAREEGWHISHEAPHAPDWEAVE